MYFTRGGLGSERKPLSSIKGWGSLDSASAPNSTVGVEEKLKTMREQYKTRHNRVRFTKEGLTVEVSLYYNKNKYEGGTKIVNLTAQTSLQKV